jgi:hypothetical protein
MSTAGRKTIVTRNPGGKWKERLPASVSLVPASTRDFLFFVPSFFLLLIVISSPFVIIFFCTIFMAFSFSSGPSFPFHAARHSIATRFIPTLESSLPYFTLYT